MNLGDLVSETFHSLTANKVRSGLTILGIVVGIASVIAMLAIGEGSQRAVTSRIESVGSNLLTVRAAAPGQQGGGVRMAPGSVQSLTRDDAETLAGLDLVAAVAPQSSSTAQLVVGSSNTNAQITGVTAAYADVNSLELSSGSFITDRDDAAYSRVIVLGATTAEELFGDAVDSAVGQRVRAGSLLFTVAGVLQEKGTSGTSNADASAFVPLSTLQRLMTGSEYLSTIQLLIAEGDQMDAAEADVQATLLQAHGISDESLADFRIQNMSDLLETMTEVTGTFTTLLAAIASISLLVGGIGIMNMMLTAVTERTREIGLRKALGADEGAITTQFLTESVTLTLIGGALGILAGWAAAQFVAPLMGMTTQAVVSLDAIGLATGVSAFIGIVFGFYPARRAARMSPIEALRYQ